MGDETVGGTSVSCGQEDLAHCCESDASVRAMSMSGQSPLPTPLQEKRGPLGWMGAVKAQSPANEASVVRPYLVLLLAFLASRAALYAAGLRMSVDLRWMFLSDPADLQAHLLQTIYYFHAFAPGTDLLSGILLKLAPAHLVACATAIFWACGFVLAACLFHLLEVVGASRRVALAVAFAFSILPQSLYLEHLYLYTYPCTALLCLMAVLFRRALLAGKASVWAACFLTGAVLGWLYTTFHLFWLGLVIIAAFALARPGTRRSVLVGAAVPFLLLFSLYAKNYAVFGVFGATSWGGANLTLTTTRRMPESLRNEWIEEGKLSPFAAISVFAPPGDYLKFFPKEPHYPWPGSNELEKPSLGSPNYNHGLFLDVNRQRREDAVYYIKHQPLAYLATVFGHNLPELFSSTTHWHPSDTRPESPHAAHRRVLGGYERFYDRLVHRFPVAPVGLYLFLPPFFILAAREIWRGLRSATEEDRVRAALLAFGGFQVLFVVGISCLFTAQESARYRYAIEPFIWLTVAAGAPEVWSYLRRTLMEPTGS